MKIIIGLGNPGKKYERTRHNAGFLCMDFLQQELAFTPFVLDKKMSAETSSGMLGREKTLLVKPDTFMNGSGTAVQALLSFYKLSASDIIVIHDDLDIAPGTHKVTMSSRAAGHNGVQNIIDTIGTQDFCRIRLGIGRPTETMGVCPPEIERGSASWRRAGISSHDFVLQDFSPAELKALTALFPKVQEETLQWIKKHSRNF
ncbi:MAG: aminoacyl-tRNA hydrolase [Patescibacteria group bacterium]